MSKTLILTLQINKEAEEYFTELRNQHFPANINYLRAHLTLFHNLPDDEYVHQSIKICCDHYSRFKMDVTEVRSIGNGVAFKIQSDSLMQLHANLQNRFKSFLIPQDQQRLWPHITIQNKVPATVANQLAAQLKMSFEPFSIEAEGISVWEYLNGPWSLLQNHQFTGKP
jgi:2'-5' RNA ligase